jgi:hypothetical protein
MLRMHAARDGTGAVVQRSKRRLGRWARGGIYCGR